MKTSLHDNDGSSANSLDIDTQVIEVSKEELFDEALETLTYALSLWENGSFSYAEKEIVSLFDLPVGIAELQEQVGEEASDPLEFERFVSRTLFKIAKSRMWA